MAEEPDPDSVAGAFPFARLEKFRKRGLQDAPHGGAVAVLQSAIVAPLVGEVEVDPARLGKRSLGSRESEALRALGKALETLGVGLARALQMVEPLIHPRKQKIGAQRGAEARRKPLG